MYSPYRNYVSNRNTDLRPSHQPHHNTRCIISLRRSGFCLFCFADLIKEKQSTKLLHRLVKSKTHLLWTIGATSFCSLLQSSSARIWQCFIHKFFCLLLGDLSLHSVAFKTSYVLSLVFPFPHLQMSRAVCFSDRVWGKTHVISYNVHPNLLITVFIL